MTLQPADLDRLEREHQESPGAPPDLPHVCLTCWQPWPCDASRLVAAARLGAAWQEAEAALPEGWHLDVLAYDGLEIDYWQAEARQVSGEMPVDWESDYPSRFGRGPTPAAALLALAEALRKRP